MTMRCKLCEDRYYVLDTRLVGTNAVRRRRVCHRCGHRLTTYEIEAGPLRDIAMGVKLLKGRVRRAAGKIAPGRTKQTELRDERIRALCEAEYLSRAAIADIFQISEQRVNEIVPWRAADA